MITEIVLRSMLIRLGFSKRSNIYTKHYNNDTSIKVDFNKKEKQIMYHPVDKSFSAGEFPTREKNAKGFVIHRDTTLDFSKNENFVCLVCVHLLLTKGYEAKHIVFEPAFKVGTVNKPSYGDILVFDKEYKPLVLIENKTFGSSFTKEWLEVQKNGGQLFSYLGPLVNELGMCDNLVLFAADYDDKEIIPKSIIITLKDNDKRIAELDNPKTFANAHGKYFEVWRDTYVHSFATKGLIEKDIAPYTVGKTKYTIHDLKGLSHAEIKPIYHEFATILRNNAITDFEHSFYILIDLFLCKITDEINNPRDLQFYYKGVNCDTPKEYCGRLLKLYQQGKKQLFDVDIINKEEDDIKQVFDDTNRSLTNGLFAAIKDLFEEIKFYNIKKFNFIDVENKEEFDLNFQILIKIAALIQDINLSNSETNHFFGDLFEGLLSRNVHQTEGQFFTPLPVVNFIIRALPEFLDSESIKVLDYSCGAGHFLTEFIRLYPKAKVYGIEKSQTLSQVAKISTIINGSKDSRIVFKDALSYINTSEARFVSFDEESFDYIIANPPYSVKGFLETMEDRDRSQFELIKAVDEKAYSSNKSIECFFIERAKQFLRTNGIMGIILPISLLKNEGIYEKTREYLFAHFNILSVVVMNSRTFGSTGTNTIILFAQKVGKNAEGLVNTFIEKKDYRQYVSWKEIDDYITRQGYNRDDYFAFMQDEVLSKRLADNAVFQDYRENFHPKPVTKQLQKEWFKNSVEMNQKVKEKSNEKTVEFYCSLDEFLSSKEYEKLEKTYFSHQFIDVAKRIEINKLKVFIQVNSNYVALLQSPSEKNMGKTNKKEIIRFLGYDWSNRKGDEGIKYITDSIAEETNEKDKEDRDDEIVTAINSIKNIKTPLYNPEEPHDPSKFAFAIRNHIVDNCKGNAFKKDKKRRSKHIENEMPNLLTYRRLSDMIDFGHYLFNKKIEVNAVQKTEIISKWDIVKLGEIASIKKGTAITSKETRPGNIKVVAGGKDFAFLHDEPNCPKNTITVSASGAYAGYVNYWDEPIFASDCSTINSNGKIRQRYLYYYLKHIQKEIYKLQNGQAQPHVYPNDLKKLPVALPPVDVQQEIIKMSERIDINTSNAYNEINSLKAELNTIIGSIKGKRYKLGKIADFKNGLNYNKSSKGDNISIVGVADFRDNKTPVWNELEKVTINGSLKDDYLLHKNDLVTVRSNGSRDLVGRFMYIDCEPRDKTSFSGFSIRVRPNSRIVVSEFLFYLLSSDEVRRQLTTGSNGANIKSLNQSLLSNVEITIPSIEEQWDRLAEFKKIEKKIQNAKKKIESAPEKKSNIIEERLK